MNRPVSCVVLLLAFVFQSIVVEADAMVVTAVGGNGAFFRSVDSGETWELGRFFRSDLRSAIATASQTSAARPTMLAIGDRAVEEFGSPRPVDHRWPGTTLVDRSNRLADP